MKDIEDLLVRPSSTLKLSEYDPDNTLGRNQDDPESEFGKLQAVMSDLQYKLYVEKGKSILVVLQGMDTSGKDGTIRHVISAFNPVGCRVESFKAPTNEELSHDFLWRIHKVVPQKGLVGVFNRSHYEDVVEVRVQNLVPKSVWYKRYDRINQFERGLTEDKVKIIKFYLHISKQEQKKRLLERLSHPEKRWKVNEYDFEKHKKWEQYLKAYRDAIIYCSKKDAPWYIIPANKKWFRNWVISKIIIDTMRELKIRYPKYVPPNMISDRS